MKALVFEKYGKAKDVLELRDIPEREPEAGEVKVKILLSPMNPSDVYNTIEGTYSDAVGKTIWNHGREPHQYTIDPEGNKVIPSLPHIPGLEAVGTVVKAGKGLRGRMLLGKRVVVVGAAKGNWQQYNVVLANQALPVGKKLTDEQASTFFVNPVTAYLMLVKVLKCRKGEVLMQSAANSELGKMVIRLCKELGVETINLIRNNEQAAHLKSIGANHIIDITKDDLKAQVHKITGGKGVPYALDPIGGQLASDMVQCLGLKGRMLVYGTLTRDPIVFSPRDLMTPLTRIDGFFLPNYLERKSMLQKLMIIKKVERLVQKGILQSEVGPIFPIDSYTEALAAVNQPGNKGKVLLRPNE